VRQVLDYAKSTPCVLLLDEFDAIAKRRDDSSEIGELKRLVTVLLQEIDDWPATGLLIAATNHPNLLDPAIWRRFELIIEFPLPDDSLITAAISHFLGRDAEGVPIGALVGLFRGSSFSDIERDMALVRREAVLAKRSPSDVLIELLRARVQTTLPRHERHELAEAMLQLGLSHREVSELTGVSRDTLRKRAPRKAAKG
jgi:SpoVK/Ycf46/Vps4 family AAA+-type ATPase